MAVVLLALATGCAYGFEGDDAVFACEKDADCSDGNACGDHVLADKTAYSICTGGDRVPAIGLRVNAQICNDPAFDPSTGRGSWDANLTWNLLGSTVTAVTVASADVGCDGSDNARDGGSTACCIGGPQEKGNDYQGRGSVLCFLPPAALDGATETTPLQVALVLAYSASGSSVGNGQVSGPIPLAPDAPIVWGEVREANWSVPTLPQSCP